MRDSVVRRTRNRALIFVTLFLVTVSSASAGPRGGASPSLADLSLEELMNVEVVYAASLHEQTPAEAPASVTIVTADEIRAYGHRTLADVIRSVRGFYGMYDRNYEYAGVRGFGRPGDYNSRILLLLNGHRMNDNIFQQAFLGTEFPIDLEMVDRIEFIRGPGSSLYGTSALFAVVNVVTRDAAALEGAWVGASGGSGESYAGQLDYGGTLRSGEKVILSGSLLDAQGNDHYYPEFDDPATNNGVASGLDGDQAARVFGRLARGSLVLEGAHVRRDKQIPTAAWEMAFNDPNARAIDSRGYLSLRYDHAAGDRSRLFSELSYDWYDYEGSYPYDYGDTEPDIVISQDADRGRWWTGGLRYSRDHGRANTFTVGSEYRRNTRQDMRFWDEYEVGLDDSRTSGVYALYTQENLAVRPGVTMNVGVRHDHYDSFGGTTNPRFALIWTPAASTTLKGLYGRAFRAPNIFELYYNDGEGETATQKSNPDLRPERIATYELVLERTLARNLQGMVSAWTFETDNLISLVTDPKDELLVYRNVDRVTARGVEAELHKYLPGGSATASYAYQECEDRATDEILTNSPRHLAKLGLNGPFLVPEVTAGVQVQYTSERKTVAGTTVSGFVVTHVTATSRFLRDRLELTGGVFNLFDERYADPASEEHLQDRIEQDGRSYWIRLRCRI